jgi:hypothetical protein
MSGQSPEIRHVMIQFYIFFCWFFTLTSVATYQEQQLLCSNTDRCAIELFGKEQVDMFMMKIPSIERPEPEVQTTVV